MLKVALHSCCVVLSEGSVGLGAEGGVVKMPLEVNDTSLLKFYKFSFSQKDNILWLVLMEFLPKCNTNIQKEK